ncbi:MAG: flagellar biosynthetic protein FliO [Betaproteobacteria bacterium]|nr:flagellar biosynthetic protein FliO [Betaproteobacteria bacterium]
MGSTNWLYIAMNFAIVLALLAGVLYVLKRMQGGNLLGMPTSKIKVIEMVSVAPRQKVVLLRVKDQDVLIGVSPQQINAIATFPVSAEELLTEPVPSSAVSEGTNSLAPMALKLSAMLAAAQNKNKV